jgi:hypothetical protein
MSPPSNITRDPLLDIGGMFMLRFQPLDTKYLKTLELQDIDLYGRSSHVIMWLNLRELVKLKMRRWHNMVPFLMGMVLLLRSNDPPPLRSLQIIGTLDTTATVEHVLDSARGLRKIAVYTGWSSLPQTRYILRHASTLKMLPVGRGSCQPYSIEDLRTILVACTSIEQLGIDLPHECVGYMDSWEDAEVFELRRTMKITPMQVYASLIADLPRIHTLRVLNSVYHRALYCQTASFHRSGIL